MDRSIWEAKGPEFAVAVILAALALCGALALGGAPRVGLAVLCAVLLVVAALTAYGWHRARARAARADDAAAGALEAQRSDRERLERHVRRLEEQQRQATQLMRRLRQSWAAEREWNRELRGQIQAMSARHGMLAEGGGENLHKLILGAAIELVEAEKGMLISREDEDGDGSLDVVLSHGFDHDPEHSAVAQRFAREVLARDEIVREDEPVLPPDTQATPADEEIDALVAIPLYLRDRFHGVIVCANRAGGFEEVGDEMLLALGDHAGSALHHGRLHHELSDAHRSAVRVLAEAVAAHDPVLHRETGELAVHAALLAKELGLEERERDVLVCATLLRAVGYLALPDGPLLRPGPLTPDERSLIELHPRLGFNILMQAPALHDVAVCLLYHHERFDGSGYPAGLAGRDIPLASRALAVLEAYGAMTHERPYRTPWSPEEACEALVEVAATQLDPEITELFVEQVRRAPRLAQDDVGEAVLDALPLEPGRAGDGLPSGLVATATDSATLLGDRRAIEQDISAAARRAGHFGVVVIELADLPRVNAEDGFPAGDRLIQRAARSARRAAARVGGTAYRLSGRRLAMVVPTREGHLLPDTLEQVRAEFLSGPSIRAGMAAWTPGEPGESVLARARAALEHDGA